MLDSRPITRDDVTQIFKKPWEASAIDIVANDLDLLPREEFLDKIVNEFARFYGGAVFDTAEPEKVLAIIGIHPEDNEPNVWWTWFYASHEFPQRWKEITAFTKDIMEKHVIIENIKEMRAYSPAGNKPEGVYWFRKLGFHKAQDFVITVNSGYNIYLFQRFFNT